MLGSETKNPNNEMGLTSSHVSQLVNSFLNIFQHFFRLRVRNSNSKELLLAGRMIKKKQKQKMSSYIRKGANKVKGVQ